MNFDISNTHRFEYTIDNPLCYTTPKKVNMRKLSLDWLHINTPLIEALSSVGKPRNCKR